MDSLDLFPAAGIRFISVQHEQNAAHMADGYARVSGRNGVCIAQNGPGSKSLPFAPHKLVWAAVDPVVDIKHETELFVRARCMQKCVRCIVECES